MLKKIVILFTMLSFALGTSEGQATSIDLFDWGLNIDGSLTIPGDPIPASVDTSGFDFLSGLGTISITLTGSAGAHSVLGFFDHEIDEPINSYFNEKGAVSGVAAAGQSWEIDEPGFVDGDIFENFQNAALDNGIGTSIHGAGFSPLGDDISMAMGWDFVLSDALDVAVIDFILSDTTIPSGFHLIHSDPQSDADIYFSSNLDITSIPEPGTLILLVSGLFGLAGLRRIRLMK
jgi:hypothetical protein